MECYTIIINHYNFAAIVLRARSVSNVDKHILRERAANYPMNKVTNVVAANFSECPRLLAYIRKKCKTSEDRINEYIIPIARTFIDIYDNDYDDYVFKDINISRTYTRS